jgi:hypothetical protein
MKMFSMAQFTSETGACFNKLRQLKVALTVTSVFMVTLQVVPDTVVQPAAHPPNVCPLLGVAVSATEEPDANAAEHVAPQLMPDGELTMTPFAPPVTATKRV